MMSAGSAMMKGDGHLSKSWNYLLCQAKILRLWKPHAVVYVLGRSMWMGLNNL